MHSHFSILPQRVFLRFFTSFIKLAAFVLFWNFCYTLFIIKLDFKANVDSIYENCILDRRI